MSVERFLAKLKQWRRPWTVGTEPVELHRAILEEVESQVMAVGGGRRLFPFDRVEVRLLAVGPADRARLEAVAQAAWDLENDIRERLRSREVRLPDRLEVSLQVTDVDGPEFAGRRWAVAFSRSPAPAAGSAGSVGAGRSAAAAGPSTSGAAGAAAPAASAALAGPGLPTTAVPVSLAATVPVGPRAAGAAPAAPGPEPAGPGMPATALPEGSAVSGSTVPEEAAGAAAADSAAAPGPATAASAPAGAAAVPLGAPGSSLPASAAGAPPPAAAPAFGEAPTAKLSRPGSATGGPPLRLSVLKGKAVREVYVLAADRIHLGRLEEVLDHTGRVRRRNDVAFLEEGEVNETVSREHARIGWDPESRAYWLRDEGSASGTIIFRAGRPIEVSRHDRRGVRLQTGDELYLGRAALRVEIEEASGR